MSSLSITCPIRITEILRMSKLFMRIQQDRGTLESVPIFMRVHGHTGHSLARKIKRRDRIA